jgi:anti-anti-sigma regulatory factor
VLAGRKLRFKHECNDQYTRNRNVTILEVAGRLTLGTPGPSLQDTARDLLHSQHKNVIPDLSRVTCLDRSSLGQLVASSATVASGSVEIRLVNLTDSDRRPDGAHKRLDRFFDLSGRGDGARALDIEAAQIHARPAHVRIVAGDG